MSDSALARGELQDITITISSQREEIAGWEGLQVSRGIDTACDAFSFRFPWQPSPENIDRFRAYRTSLIEVRYRDEVVVAGTMEKLSLSTGPEVQQITIEGRGTSGALVDQAAGPPFELFGSFNAIAAQISPVSVRAIPEIHDLSLEIEPGQTVYSVLSTLAAARGYWAIPQSNGTLQFRPNIPGEVVAELSEGTAPLQTLQTGHDLTRRFAEYQIIETASGDVFSATAEDRGVEYPGFTKRRIDQPRQASDPQAAARFARSRGIIDSYSCLATVTGWTVNGRLWRPGDRVIIDAPTAMIYRPYTFLVSRAELTLDETGGAQTALTLTFPEAYASSNPVFPYPWSVV